jgi:hypothetical protein
MEVLLDACSPLITCRDWVGVLLARYFLMPAAHTSVMQREPTGALFYKDNLTHAGHHTQRSRLNWGVLPARYSLMPHVQHMMALDMSQRRVAQGFVNEACGV